MTWRDWLRDVYPELWVALIGWAAGLMLILAGRVDLAVGMLAATFIAFVVTIVADVIVSRVCGVGR